MTKTEIVNLSRKINFGLFSTTSIFFPQKIPMLNAHAITHMHKLTCARAHASAHPFTMLSAWWIKSDFFPMLGKLTINLVPGIFHVVICYLKKRLARLLHKEKARSISLDSPGLAGQRKNVSYVSFIGQWRREK